MIQVMAGDLRKGDVFQVSEDSTRRYTVSESWILLRILDVRGLKLVEVPGESPARAIRRLFNVPHFRRVLHRLEYDGEIEVLTGAEWSERGVHFYDQRPTGRYWAMRHTDE